MKRNGIHKCVWENCNRILLTNMSRTQYLIWINFHFYLGRITWVNAVLSSASDWDEGMKTILAFCVWLCWFIYIIVQRWIKCWADKMANANTFKSEQYHFTFQEWRIKQEVGEAWQSGIDISSVHASVSIISKKNFIPESLAVLMSWGI